MHLIQIDYPNKLILVSEKKKIIRPKKNKAPLEEKQTIETNCRFGSERSEFLYSLKGWDVWGNKVREHIILQDDAWTNRMPDSAANER